MRENIGARDGGTINWCYWEESTVGMNLVCVHPSEYVGQVDTRELTAEAAGVLGHRGGCLTLVM